VTRERLEGVLVLAVAGRLGEASSGQLTEILEAAVDANQAGFVVDLSGVDYLSSAGLLAIDRAADRLVLCAVRDPVRIALDLAGLPPYLAVEPSREQAIARIAFPTDSITR
jgi:anti-anti-sigma factor